MFLVPTTADVYQAILAMAKVLATVRFEQRSSVISEITNSSSLEIIYPSYITFLKNNFLCLT